MTERRRVTIADGKYTVIQEESGGMRFLRHGGPWSEPNEQIRYGNMILAMAYEIDELRTALEATRKALDLAQRAFPRALATSAEREFGREGHTHLDCQNERPR